MLIFNRISRTLFCVVSLCSLCTWICADEPQLKPHGKDFSASRHSVPGAPHVVLPPEYVDAVRNAETATSAQVSRSLTGILLDNNHLIWKNVGGEQHLLVATWTSHDTFYPAVGTTFTEKYQVWVTAAPELRRFCESYKQANPPLPRRMEQLLGLPPDSGHKFVVELWVKPQDLFRPSADPEISDHEAQLSFPVVPGFVSVSDDYKAWYDSSKQQRYHPKSGPAYPWTRLGYTYDWGNASSRVGLSEFVIRKGATLTVHSVVPTKLYAVSPQ